MNSTVRFETDVVIIGGGATGTGIMRDCALRGIKCILLEKDDLASGTQGEITVYCTLVRVMPSPINIPQKNVSKKTAY